MFQHLEPYAGDPIFRLGDECQRDTRARKVNLTVGLYYDEDGAIPLPASVREAERRMAEAPQPRPYLPIEGLASFREAVQALLFGKDADAVRAGKVATIQSVGGTGALKVGADFLHAAYPDSEVWICNPAWENHNAIFQGAGIATHSYSYYDPQTKGLCFDRMMDELGRLPAASIVLLHACCHNPTGVDLSDEQWTELIGLLASRRLIPFVDIAYQGFGRGLVEDSFAIRRMAEAGLTFLVANSFSKNFSLYAERCGGLSVVCGSADEADRVMGQLKAVARRTWSTPPRHGGQIVATVLGDDALRHTWEQEVGAMRQRILAVRQMAFDLLAQKLPGYDASYFVDQQGMFTYTGLSQSQLQALRQRHGVYIIDSGRVSVPGLNAGNVAYFTDALADVLEPVVA